MESPTRRARFQLYTNDESRVIENAVSSAIRAVLDAIRGVHAGKLVEYQSVVEERDKEIGRLEYKLRQHELELRVVRGQRDGYRRLALEGQGCVDADLCEDSSEVPAAAAAAAAAGGEDARSGSAVHTDFPCVSAKRPPSLPDPRVDRDAAYSSHDPSDNQERSSSSSPWGATDGIADSPADSPADRYAEHATGPPVKEEPSGCEAFFIKLEMCEQSCGSSHQDDPDHPDLPDRSPTQRRRLTDAERNKRYRQRCRSTPEGLRACREKERLRYLKRRVLVAEMSEDARRRKREMWRAAARRHRDRKMSALLPHCPPAGGDLFDDWPALHDTGDSPGPELDRCTRSALRGHHQEHSHRDV